MSSVWLKGEAPGLPLFFFACPGLNRASLIIILLAVFAASCVHATAVPSRFAEADARVRGDLGIPDETPSPRVVLADEKTLARLDAEVRRALHVSGGGLYDPKTQTIYLDASRYRDASLYHELAHHYMRFMTEQQRQECLARLYELHIARSSFSGCSH